MPEAKTKDRISNFRNGLPTLNEQLGTNNANTPTYHMVLPKDSENISSSNSAPMTDAPLNLVMNRKHSRETLCAPVAAISKTSPQPPPNFTSDIYPDPMSVPTNSANKLNYFPKTVSNFQGVPVSGQFLQRIGPFQYNPAQSGNPLVAFVNPTATSVIPQGLKPVFTAPSSVPNVGTMNQIVYNSMPPPKTNVTPQPPTPVILVRSSAPLSKSGNYQYVMTPAEKSSMSFPKSATQTIFGNESGKFVPVATIVPNNASLVTNSLKNVTSALSGEPVLSTNGNKYPVPRERTKVTDCYSADSKQRFQGPNTLPWYPNMNNPSIELHPPFNENVNNSKSGSASSHPLNLIFQPLPDNKEGYGNIPLSNIMCNQKNNLGRPLLPHGLVFHPPTAYPSPLLFNPAAYSIPNQDVYFPNPAHLDFHGGFPSQLAFKNHMAALKSKVRVKSSKPRPVKLPKSPKNSSSPIKVKLTDKNTRIPVSDDPPMTLRIDSIFSLADDSGVSHVPLMNMDKKAPKKTKVKSPTKLVSKDNKVVVPKTSTTLSKPRGRRPKNKVKDFVKKQPKPEYKHQDISLEISDYSELRASTLKSDITVSCHANDFKSLYPMSEEERKLKTFFQYLGLCPSFSNDASNKNGPFSGTGDLSNGQSNVSKELARCFTCYVVVPMFIPLDGCETVNVKDPPKSLKALDKCSKECRHAFLNKQHATTGIVPRDVDFDSSWKIIPQTQKCSHTRKKYCRKSKTKASSSFTSSHCRRFGCIGCSTKGPIAHSKIRYFRKNNKDSTGSGPVGTKEQTSGKTSPHIKRGRKKVYGVNKKLKSKPIGSERSLGKDSTCNKVLGEKNVPVVKKRKISQDRQSSAKIFKKDIIDVENVMCNIDIIEPESVDEVSPFVSSFLDIEDSCQSDSSLTPEKVIKPEPIASPKEDISASSERIQRLKEILKEKQKDLEIARQLLL